MSLDHHREPGAGHRGHVSRDGQSEWNPRVALHHRVCAELEHVSAYPDYKPHVTVAYLKKDRMDPYYYRSLYEEGLEGESFWVDSLEFKTSMGNRYVLALNGTKSKVARTVGSAERVAMEMMAGRR